MEIKHPHRISHLRLFISLLFSCIITCIVQSQDYKQIWNHINRNERDEANKILESKLKNNTISTDEYITYIYLQTFDGQEEKITDFAKQIGKSNNPDAYIYALWFNEAVVGAYGRKAPHQLELLNQLINDKNKIGTLVASSHYSLGSHYVFSNKFDLLRNEYDKIGALENWQFVGPFNNISGSGFNKNYEPVNDPSNSSVFISSTNAPIKWFTPVEKSTEAWQATQYFIADQTGGIVFAQTFVNSDKAQDVYLCSGFGGNIKIWVNDQLIIKVPEERITEMDAYTSKCHLNAGFNRILVQIGSDESETTFIVRLTDSHYNAVANIESTSEPKPYTKVSGENLNDGMPQFAETYFLDKIKKEPENIINYLLLQDVYIRIKKVFEARTTLEKALQLAPDNSLLKFELILCYLKEGNRSGVAELYQYFKDNEKGTNLSYIFRGQELQNQGKYQEELDTLDQRIKLYGQDESTYENQILALSKLGMIPKLVSVATEAFQKYPDNAKFVNYIFNIEDKLNKNPKRAIKILEDYLENHYNYSLIKILIQAYFDQQNISKPYKLIEEQIAAWPYNPNHRLDLINEYYGQQRYKEAYEVCQFMLKMKPYSGYYFENKATLEAALNKEDEAIESYRMALKYEPTLYQSREKLRTLEKKKNLFESVTGENIDELIKKTGKGINLEDYDYYYLKNEKNVVLYEEGGREEIHSVAIKVLNQRGVDDLSDFSVPYNSNYETFLIEEAQLIKSNGKKNIPETDGNHIVWTGLEVKDVLYVRYRIRSYQTGKFAREFYDKFIFDGLVPVELAKYSLIIPKSKIFRHEVLNGEVVPKIRDLDEYRIYEWAKNSPTGFKEEPYMPSRGDFVTTLHISTISDWNEIAEWYRDVVYSKISSDNDYDVTAAYKELFEGKGNLTADEKAKIIYDYIEKNISYSSVSFRQSDIVPQKSSKTISTHLGDCKDISTLFVSLANMCNLKANLVLVSTRDNGQKDMFLPSFLFNHCIVKYTDEQNNEHFLELTDRDLPFKSLPSNLYHALSLTIPERGNDNSKQTILPILGTMQTKNKLRTAITIDFTGNDMNVTSETTQYGNQTSPSRNTYRSLSEENAIKEMEPSFSRLFSNPIKIKSVKFDGLNENLDSIGVTTKLTATNQVKKIGAVSAFTIPYTDILFTASPFNPETRKYDFEYWAYESVDEYETGVDIVLPAEKSFVDTPTDENVSFHGITYSLKYKKIAPNKLNVVRKVNMNRENIKPEEYEEFKAFVSKIIDIEGMYITFK